jgi:choline-sulfatase
MAWNEKKHVDHGLHYSLNLAPTLAEIFDKPAKQSWDGTNYAPAIKDGKNCGRDFLVMTQCAHVCQQSVRFGDWLLYTNIS